ncbi:MAG: ABC transporter permease [Coriobacteriia bacterium]|nr:ABC transporter permease [Coriobacteriia bacterium]
MIRALAAEVMKLKRASLLLWTVATALVAPALSNVFLTAQDFGQAHVTWPEFFGMAPMTMGTWWGILLLGLVTAFLFARDYTDGVAPTMLTTPMRRECFVLAKFLVLGAWILGLALLALVAQAAWATILGLDGFSWTAVWPVVGDVLIVTLLIFLTLPVVALVAVASRGVLAPMLLSAFGFTAGMIGGVAGWGDWLPWAMPTAIGGTFLGPAVSSETQLMAGSWAIEAGVFAIGIAAVIWWVNHADSRE